MRFLQFPSKQNFIYSQQEYVQLLRSTEKTKIILNAWLRTAMTEPQQDWKSIHPWKEKQLDFFLSLKILSFSNVSLYDKFSIFTYFSQVNLLSQYKRKLIPSFAFFIKCKTEVSYLGHPDTRKNIFTPVTPSIKRKT